jgi:hypothetical protein
VAPPNQLEELRRAADALRGARVLHVNATPYGGGVSELLRSVVPVLSEYWAAENPTSPSAQSGLVALDQLCIDIQILDHWAQLDVEPHSKHLARRVLLTPPADSA